MNFKLNNLLKKLQSDQRIIFGALFIISVVVSIQNIALGVDDFWGGQHTHYNNFMIFKYSFLHLIENKNLYSLYLNEYADLYKYSPSFAVIMGFFYYLPDSVGLIIWNTLNSFILYFAITSLKSLNSSKKLLLFLFLIFELILSMENSQCNALIAGLMIISFNMFEKGQNTLATLFIVLGACIKIFPIVGLLLFLFYPNKLKSVLSFIFWSALLLILPVVFIGFPNLIWQYKNWHVLLLTDQSESIGMSLYAFTQFVMPLKYFKSITLLIGAIMLLTPLLKFKKYTNQMFRSHYLALILIWTVIFNVKAESPTFVIVMAGAALWYFASKPSQINTILILLTLFFTSLWFTDLVPRSIRANFIDAKYIKSIFPILVLFKLYFDLLLKNYVNTEVAET